MTSARASCNEVFVYILKSVCLHFITYLIISKSDQDDVGLVNPDFFAQFSTNMTESFDAIKAHSFEASCNVNVFVYILKSVSCLFTFYYIPLPNILMTCAYSWPSSLKTNSRLRPSFSFLPRRRFLPPFPLFFGMVAPLH